jgi:hypothetical protein
MKMLIDIPDKKRVATFIKAAQASRHVTSVQRVPARAGKIVSEAIENAHIHRLADQVKAGKVKTRPASALLNEL